MIEEPFLTTNEVAARLRVTRHTVSGWIRTGRLPAYRGGHKWLIRESDLTAFLPLKRFGPAARR